MSLLSVNILTIIIFLIYIFKCPMINSFEADFFELGTINYGHLISSQDWIRKKEENKMLYAMEHVGFMVLTNHGISKYILDNVWNETRDFFDSSKDNKESVLMTKDYIYGYSADERLDLSEDIEYFKGKNNDKIIDSMPVDQKEMFAAWIGAPNTDRINNVLWPLKPSGMKQAWIEYYRECEKIASQLLKSFAIILELDSPLYFEQFIDDHMSAMRALNYPKQINEPPKGSLRCSPHSDYGTFTLLRQDGVGGLQLDIDGNNNWVDIISDQYDFIVNLGNTMKLWTNDRFKSTRHRVVNPRNLKEKQRRQSIAFFHNLNGNAMIETIPSCKYKNGSSKYKPIYFKDFLDSLHHGSQTNYDIKNEL